MNTKTPDEQNPNEKNQDKKTPVKLKKPYSTPVLTEFGDIRQITENTQQPMGAGDNHQSNSKTGP